MTHLPSLLFFTLLDYRELLVESREAFYLTLDRLRGLGGSSHPLDAQLSEHLEEVENLLSSQGENGSDGDGAASFTTPMTTPKKYDLASRRLMSAMTSTPQSNRSIKFNFSVASVT